MHEESDSETEPVTINQCFGVVEPPCDFCDFHWGRSMVVPFFFPAKGRVCCTSHRSVHLMHTESIWHISFSQQAHKTASTVKDTTYECFKMRSNTKNRFRWTGASWRRLECYLSLGSQNHVVKNCWLHQVERCCPNKAYGCGTSKGEHFQSSVVDFAMFFFLPVFCGFCCCLLWFCCFCFFLGLDDFLHFPPKIWHKISWSEEIEEVVFPTDSGNG